MVYLGPNYFRNAWHFEHLKMEFLKNILIYKDVLNCSIVQKIFIYVCSCCLLLFSFKYILD